MAKLIKWGGEDETVDNICGMDAMENGILCSGYVDLKNMVQQRKMMIINGMQSETGGEGDGGGRAGGGLGTPRGCSRPSRRAARDPLRAPQGVDWVRTPATKGSPTHEPNLPHYPPPPLSLRRTVLPHSRRGGGSAGGWGPGADDDARLAGPVAQARERVLVGYLDGRRGPSTQWGGRWCPPPRTVLGYLGG